MASSSGLLAIWIVSLFALCYVNGDGISMQDICQNHKDRGRCNNPNIKKQCPDVCGDKPPSNNGNNGNNGNGGDNNPPPTTKKPSSSGGKHCDKRSPCVSMDEANAAFRARCEASNGALKQSCYDHCRYDEDATAMKKAFLGGPCPLPQLRTYLTLASNSKDNTGCCEDTGVLAQKKTAVCGCFCNPTGPVWPQKGETAKYAPCVGVLQGIMQCHYFAEGAN